MTYYSHPFSPISLFASAPFYFDFHYKSLTLTLPKRDIITQGIFVAKPQGYKCESLMDWLP